MNKSALRSFSAWARRYLISNICDRAQLIGVTKDTVVPIQAKTATNFMVNGVTFEFAPAARDHFVAYIKEVGWENAIEEIAYTWFNRILAIRFMEVNGYLENGNNGENIYVIGSVDAGRKFPDAVSRATELKYIDKETVYKYQDAEDNAGLFRYVLMKQCSELSQWMPDVFEKVSDYTDLLLPETLLLPDGLIDHLTHDLNAEDFDISAEGNGQVEIFGWMYQFYIAEKKKAVDESDEKVNKGTLPAKTQLFTPDWIVRYMVENTLGKIWVASHEESNLKDSMRYYLEPDASDEEVIKIHEELKRDYQVVSIRDIKFIDPCCGSGHVLVYAFDLFYRMYLEEGYTADMIPSIILENNLYGMDVDKRAIQLTSFALTMKARSYNKRLFQDGYHFPNVVDVHESNTITDSAVDTVSKLLGISLDEKEIIKECVFRFQNAEYFGTLINNFEYKSDEYASVLQKISGREKDVDYGDIFEANTFQKYYGLVCILLKQASFMSYKYDCVVTNPPYLKTESCGDEMVNYAKTFYPNSKTDMFAMFIERCISYTKAEGIFSMITMHSWMFLSSYEKMRESLQNKMDILSLLHLGPHGFDEIGGEVVQTVAFSAACRKINAKGTFVRLIAGKCEKDKEKDFFDIKNRYYLKQEKFKNVKGMPYTTYWASEPILRAFESSLTVGDISEPRVGMATANNDRFIRLWYEIDESKFYKNCPSREVAVASKKKWYPFAKGGEQRKWYGNNDTVVNWQNDGYEIRNFKDEKTGRIRSHNYNLEYIYQSAITWTVIGTERTSFRFCPQGFLYSNSGYGMFCNDETKKLYLLGLMNSKISAIVLQMLSPSMGFESGYLRKVPVIEASENEVVAIVKELIELEKEDWDSFETSWDFNAHPLIIKTSKSIQECYEDILRNHNNSFYQVKELEEKLNAIFIKNYGMEDVFDNVIADKEITLKSRDLAKIIKSLLSYAVGCIMGRYSLKEDGLIYAGGEWDDSRYSDDFRPCEYGIMPIAEEEYFFEEDLCTRVIDFIKVVYGEDTLAENLKFIADALKPDSYEAPKKIIREYLFNDFFNDHYQIYQHRPIYWQLDSGKAGGFRAIAYMHRYDENTLPIVRTEFIQDLRYKYEAEMTRQKRKLDDAGTTAAKNAVKKDITALDKKIVECVAYDDLLNHATANIADYVFDLDDGMKTNYAKFLSVDGDKNKNILTVIKL